MKNILILLIICGSVLTIACNKVDAEDLGLGDASADDLISPTFTFMDLMIGDKKMERISGNFRHSRSIRQSDLESWNPQNGDVFFFRGDLIVNESHDRDIYGDFFAIVPLEPEFYWNGVGLYYDGFLYRITASENGTRIYNQGLWTIGGYCVIVQASSNMDLPENPINADIMSKIHKIKVRRGHLKKDKFDLNTPDYVTPPGLVDKFYENAGKNIRPDTAGEYIKAEDFIERTSADNGYFRSRTSDLIIKKINIHTDEFVDCSKVY